jgi:hypothetical protein
MILISKISFSLRFIVFHFFQFEMVNWSKKGFKKLKEKCLKINKIKVIVLFHRNGKKHILTMFKIIRYIQRARNVCSWGQIRDGDISWTMTSHGHFLSKWATSRGHCQRVTSCGHFVVTSRGHFCPREVLFLGEFSWTFFGWILVDTFWWW